MMWMFSPISTLKHEEVKNIHEWPKIEQILQVDPPGITALDAKEVQSQSGEGRVVSAAVTELAEVEPMADPNTDFQDLEIGSVATEMVVIQPALSSRPRKMSPRLDPKGKFIKVNVTSGKITDLTNGGQRNTGSRWES